MTRRSVAALAASALVGFAAPALAQGTLKMVPHADLKVVDPIFTTAQITIDHAMMIYDQLFAWDDKLVPKPQMVESWAAAPDKLSYTFALRPGLKFHDGTPVTAKDTVASIQRWSKRDPMGQKMAEFTAAWSVVDDRSFVLRLKEPFGMVLDTLASTAGNMPVVMREKDALTDAFTALTESVGSGPFRFVPAEYQPGNKVVYAKFVDYVPRAEPANGLAGGKIAKVDRVEWVSIPEPSTAASALVAGEVDMIEAINNDQKVLLTRSKDVKVEALSKLGWFGLLRPNHLHPPFDNPKARQALALMVDQTEYMQAAFGGGETCFSYFTCGSPFGTTAGSESFRKPDYARAKQLLAEAGYKGEKIVLLGAGDLFHHNAAAQVTAENLKKIGLNVDLQMSDWGAVITRRAKKDKPEAGGYNIYQTFSDGVSAMTPATNVSIVSTCDGRNAVGWPCDEQVEKLRDQYIRATDEAQKQQILETLHKRLWETIPYVILGKYERLAAYRTSLDGVLHTNVLALWNISKK